MKNIYRFLSILLIVIRNKSLNIIDLEKKLTTKSRQAGAFKTEKIKKMFTK